MGTRRCRWFWVNQPRQVGNHSRQVGGQVGSRGVGVVATDGVQDVNAILGQLVGGPSTGPDPSTKPRFTQSATLVSLTRLLPIALPPC